MNTLWGWLGFIMFCRDGGPMGRLKINLPSSRVTTKPVSKWEGKRFSFKSWG